MVFSVPPSILFRCSGRLSLTLGSDYMVPKKEAYKPCHPPVFFISRHPLFDLRLMKRQYRIRKIAIPGRKDPFRVGLFCESFLSALNGWGVSYTPPNVPSQRWAMR